METILNFIPAVMGLGVIDQNLDGLLTAMNTMSPNLQLPSMMGYAKIIGLCIALGVGANECYQMMLGRRGIDVMKLLHIIIISICISSAGTIANLAKGPGMLMEGIVKGSAMSKNDNIKEKEKQVAQLQEDYLKQVRESMQQMEQAQAAANAKDADGIIDQLSNIVEETVQHVGNTIKEYTLVAETKICEWISVIIRLIGEVMLQAIIYGLLVAQRIFMHLLEMIAPLMFAISLAPHFKSAWSQWLSKYISLSLWGFVTYVCLYYVFFIIDYNLDQVITAYSTLQSSVTGENAQIAAIGMQALGSTCMYIVGLLVGVKILSMVPEAASWLIPGGVSSSAGSVAGGTVTSGVTMAASAAGAVAGTSVSVAQWGAGLAGGAGQALHDRAWGNAEQAAEQMEGPQKN